MRRLLSRLLDRYNPGITLLVAIWALGFEIRRRMSVAGTLGLLADEALTSLIYVVPIMLAGWALLTLGRRSVQARTD